MKKRIKRFFRSIRPWLLMSEREKAGIRTLLVLLLGTQTVWMILKWKRNSGELPEHEVRFLEEKRRILIQKSPQSKKESPELFFFDPNTADTLTWRQLGLSPAQSRAVYRFFSSGARIEKASDIRKVFVISDKQAERLIPWIRIQPAGSRESRFVSTRTYGDFNKKQTRIINLNTSGMEEWMKIPGIGEKRASRILRYRESLGGFYAKDQLREVFGLPDSIWDTDQLTFEIGTGVYRSLRINSISPDSLHHPYLNRKMAQLIIRHREEHGPFSSVQDLKFLALFNDSVCRKIAPYLTFEQ